MRIIKYPRTLHIEGSRLQPGDEDLGSATPFAHIAGRHLVVEEKMDGANSAISFDADGQLLLQSRGHYLTGGPRERHFALFKQWAGTLAGALWERLGSRYVMYGEWLYAKHTVFYDALPHYFMEFDILDRESRSGSAVDGRDEGVFLSTEARQALLADLRVESVLVLSQGPATTLKALRQQVAPSRFKTAGWRARLCDVARARGQDPERVARETDEQDAMEGLYLKIEEGGQVVERYKFVRPDFLTRILDSGTHWLDRPVLPNQLADGVDIFA